MRPENFLEDFQSACSKKSEEGFLKESMELPKAMH